MRRTIVLHSERETKEKKASPRGHGLEESCGRPAARILMERQMVEVCAMPRHGCRVPLRRLGEGRRKSGSGQTSTRAACAQWLRIVGQAITATAL